MIAEAGGEFRQGLEFKVYGAGFGFKTLGVEVP